MARVNRCAFYLKTKSDATLLKIGHFIVTLAKYTRKLTKLDRRTNRSIELVFFNFKD